MFLAGGRWTTRRPHRRPAVITAPQLGLRPITHLPIEVLRRPVESGQFTSWAFGQRLRADGLLPSMGTVGDCYDNSVMESLWGTLQLEVLDSRTWETRAQLANAIFEWIECWYNIKRRHSSLGMLAPVVFETLHRAQTSTLDDH